MFAEASHRNWKHYKEAPVSQQMMMQWDGKGDDLGARRLQAAGMERL